MKTSSSNDSSVNVNINNEQPQTPTDENNIVSIIYGQMVGIANSFDSLRMIVIVFVVLLVFNWILSGVVLYNIYSKSDYLEKHSANTQKLVWELKRSLELEFSQERSAKAK